MAVDTTAMQAEIEAMKREICERLGVPVDNWRYGELMAEKLCRFKAKRQTIKRYEWIIEQVAARSAGER